MHCAPRQACRRRRSAADFRSPAVGGATLYARPEGNVPPVAERKGAPSNDVTPGWFRTLGIPLLAGRDFNEQDMADHPNVIIISASGAKTVFGNENPIGKTLLITSGSVPVEIIGVVGDVRSVQLNQHNDMEFYRPFAQENFPVPDHHGAQSVAARDGDKISSDGAELD